MVAIAAEHRGSSSGSRHSASSTTTTSTPTTAPSTCVRSPMPSRGSSACSARWGSWSAGPAALRARRRGGRTAAPAPSSRNGAGSAVERFVPVALTALASHFGPHIFNERNLLVSAPFAAVSAGALVSADPRRASILAAGHRRRGRLLALAVRGGLRPQRVRRHRSRPGGGGLGEVRRRARPVRQSRARALRAGPVGTPRGGRTWSGPRATRCDAPLHRLDCDTRAAAAGSGTTSLPERSRSSSPRTTTRHAGRRQQTPITVARVQAARLPGGARLLHAAGSHCP